LLAINKQVRAAKLLGCLDRVGKRLGARVAICRLSAGWTCSEAAGPSRSW